MDVFVCFVYPEQQIQEIMLLFDTQCVLVEFIFRFELLQLSLPLFNDLKAINEDISSERSSKKLE